MTCLDGQPADQPVKQMTAYELRELRERLDQTLAMDTLPRYMRSREELSRLLAEVIAEQDERVGIQRGRQADA